MRGAGPGSVPSAHRGLTFVQGWFPDLAGQDAAPSQAVGWPSGINAASPDPYRCGGSAGISPASQFSPLAVQAAGAPQGFSLAQSTWPRNRFFAALPHKCDAVCDLWKHPDADVDQKPQAESPSARDAFGLKPRRRSISNVRSIPLN